jgi:tetratricopeptide (TPR) repeat protein
MTTRLLPLALAFFSFSSYALAQAPDATTSAAPDQRAQAHFHSATAYYEEGDYEHAATEFRAAYAASPHAELLYNIYLCEERLAHLGPAIEALEHYLASDATIENRPALELRLGHLRERQAQGATTIEETDVAPSTPPPEPPVPASSGPHPLAIAGFTIAGVGLLSFAIFGGLTLSEDARLRGSCGHACSESDTSLIGTTGIVADVSAGVALAGAVLGVIGLVLPTGSGDTQVAVGPGGLTLRGAF